VSTKGRILGTLWAASGNWRPGRNSGF